MTERDPHGLSGPASSRIYDFSIGGKDNYTSDREAALEAFAAFPAARHLPRENRKFMRRAVRFLLEAGVRQFIDVGCGLPGKGNVHQVAHAVDPDARVVYVDHDPVAVVHFQALLHALPTAIAVHADAREPEGILNHPEVAALIDFDRPVGVLMISVLCHLRDEEGPEAAVGAFRDAVAPGSHLALCEFTDENLTARERSVSEELTRRNGVVVTFRCRERIAGFLDGFEPVEPGLVYAPEWRPDRPYDEPTGWLLAAVARKV
ncbi:SAM-dependent methyltransferase [Actinomadura rugatobispora]|uniref:SAM-dependent methyltransferase n=1 Tax=Actinomadura rugatobispora TaxID=1994 RepID=A0ABW0ZT52_9ACTN|nr:SAM-dependent methyltransferase [Actinomadura rugatobispora]